MVIYKGKYPKRVESTYSLITGGYGARLNDGTLVKLDVVALGYNPPKCGTELKEGTFEIIGKSEKRRGK